MYRQRRFLHLRNPLLIGLAILWQTDRHEHMQNKNYYLTRICPHKQQECIPVGCILPAHWPYAMHTPSTHAPCHAHPPSCMPPITHAPCHTHCPAMHAPCHAHPPPCHASPPPVRILDTRFWKYYLAPTSLRAVKISEERNFNLKDQFTTPRWPWGPRRISGRVPQWKVLIKFFE